MNGIKPEEYSYHTNTQGQGLPKAIIQCANTIETSAQSGEQNLPDPDDPEIQTIPTANEEDYK